MSQAKEDKPQPVALWDDSKLRPWTIDEAQETEISNANSTLQDMIQKTSGSKIAGGRGLSQIDHKPEAFLEFEKMISDPNWLNKLGTTQSDEEAEAILMELARLAGEPSAIEDQGPVSETAIAGHTDDDKLLLHSILEFNAALYNGKEKTKITGRSSARGVDVTPRENPDASIRLLTKPKKKVIDPVKNLGSIKYKSKANPAILNVSTAHFQNMLSRFNMKQKSKGGGRLTMGADGRSTFSDGSSNIGGGGNNNFADSMMEDLAKLDKDALIEMLLKERGVTPRSADPAPRVTLINSDKSATIAKSLSASNVQLEPLNLDAVRVSSAKPVASVPLSERASARAAEQNISTTPSRPESSSIMAALAEDAAIANSRPTSGNNLLAPIKIPTSPIKMSARGGSRADSSGKPISLLSTSMGSDDFVVPSIAPSPGKLGGSKPVSKMPTPRTARSTDGSLMAKSASAPTLATVSESRVPSAMGTTKSLDKLSISGQMGSTYSLSKARVADIRALRDHLLTTAGSFALNVNPQSSPDAQQEVQESIAVTREMVAQTMHKNRVDQTWDLITTPGYYEAVGPAEIFKSDIHQNFVSNDAFVKQLKERDITRCLKSNPIKKWAEDGKKNNIEIFAAGGAMKMS